MSNYQYYPLDRSELCIPPKYSPEIDFRVDYPILSKNHYGGYMFFCKFELCYGKFSAHRFYKTEHHTFFRLRM